MSEGLANHIASPFNLRQLKQDRPSASVGGFALRRAVLVDVMQVFPVQTRGGSGKRAAPLSLFNHLQLIPKRKKNPPGR
jgi:hypothetical protein